MDAQRDISAPMPYVRLVGSVVDAGRLFPPQLAVGRLAISLPLPEDLGRLAAHTGAVF